MHSIIQYNLNLLDYTLKSLLRKRLKNIGLIFIFSIVIFLIASFQLATKALNDNADVLLETVPDILVQKMSAGRHESLPVTYIDKIIEIPGIKESQCRVWGYYFDETTGANYSIYGLEQDFMDNKENLDQTLSNGFFPAKFNYNDVIISENIKKSLALNNRKFFSFFRPDLKTISFKVSGTFSPKFNILTGDLILMDINKARSLFAIPKNMATDITINITNPAEIQNIAKKISYILPDTRVITKEQIQRTYDVIFSWRSGIGSILLLSALATFIVVAWDKSSGLSYEEKKEIGILRMVGWQTTDIIKLRFYESAVISSTSFILGIIFAYIHIIFFQGIMFNPVLLGWSVLRPEILLTTSIQFEDILIIFAYTIIPYLTTTIIPAWRSSTIRPDSVI